jgi:hypothetical protein
MDSFLTTLEIHAGSAEAEYARHEQFYADYQVELRSVLVRARSHPKNTITEQQLSLMINSLEELRAAHVDAPLDPEAVRVYRDLFMQAWQAIITLEVAKKRGEAPAE